MRHHLPSPGLRWALVVLLVAGGLGLWFSGAASNETGPTRPESSAESGAADSLEASTHALVTTPAPQTFAPSQGEAPSRTGEPEPSDRPAAVHPFDQRREGIHRENALIQAANDAMDLGRADELRRVLQRYREHDPSDRSGLQQGYAIILDCLERPGPESRGAAEGFISEHRASTLRRFVRRHCIADRR